MTNARIIREYADIHAFVFVIYLEYEVVVVTGDQKGAGTDANVFITIYGKNGNSPKLQLKNNSKNCFERNHTDMFVFKTQCCGPLEKIRYFLILKLCQNVFIRQL